MGFGCHNDDIGGNDVDCGGFGLFIEEDAADQATPPTDVGEDKGTDPDTDTVISGGNYVDHM